MFAVAKTRGADPTQLRLGVDIDETLSWTVGCWMRTMIVEFGNPENLTVEAMVAKYRLAQHVPYWQSAEALAWCEDKRLSPEYQLEIDPIPGALENLLEIHESVPVEAYITMRPTVVLDATKQWLRNHGFPEAPIVGRPMDIVLQDATAWKAQRLADLYPHITGIIEDHPHVAEKLPADYPGTLFLYGHVTAPRSDIRIVPCPTWESVKEQVLLERARLLHPAL